MGSSDVAAAILAAFDALPTLDRWRSLRMACDDALRVWGEAREGGEPIVYVDSVVGMRHVVDDDLPRRALDEVDRKLRGEPVDASATRYAYLEPLSALQDDDLVIGGAAELAFYAIYNLHCLVVEGSPTASAHVVLRQVAKATGMELEAWLEAWWTRCAGVRSATP